MSSRKTAIQNLMLITMSGFCMASLGIATVAWFSANSARVPETINGVVGLRSYFYQGNGAADDPYEIVFPSHFYNLSRLQNLGVFPEKAYFRLGHDFTGTGNYQILTYDDDGNEVYGKSLDMSTASDLTILPIGGEGDPFVGDFEGNNIEIKNLTITGYPEDIGIFGYIANEGVVRDFIATNVTINSLGYTNNTSDSLNHLFGAEVDQLFDDARNIFSTADLKFTTAGGTEYLLKNNEGLQGRTFIEINDETESKVETIKGTKYYAGSFLPIFPDNEEFSFTWRASTKIIENINGTPKINLSVLEENEDFNKGTNAEIDSRIYLVATIKKDGIIYSRVIQSYLCQFFSNSTSYDAGGYSMTIACDYAGEGYTNYHHGNNIGYLAGHVDGTMDNCFVYGGHFNFNGTDQMVPIATESDTGLIGEVGKNVQNMTDPEFGAGKDTGTMNFTGIYNMIRTDVNIGEKMLTSLDGKGKYFVAYNEAYDASGNKDRDLLTTGETFEAYREYLRYNDTSNVAERKYISTYPDAVATNSKTEVTSSNIDKMNSVDFLYNRVISDTETVDRGLGVFKVATGYNNTVKSFDEETETYTFTSGTWGDHYAEGIGDCRIVNSTPFTDVYFSTAEYNHHELGDDLKWLESIGFITDPVGYRVENVTTLPSRVDIRTFTPTYERDFDYIFKMDMSQNASTVDANNYFSNTDSEFLTQYFQYKLIDNKGKTIAPGETRFGFMLRDYLGNKLSNVSSYMPVKKPSSLFSYDGKYYPANTITFKIENAHGANVSVIANGNDNVSIYSYDPTQNNKNLIQKEYTMLSISTQSITDAGATTYDMRRHFNYDRLTGETGTVVEAPSEDGVKYNRTNSVYAHIFKLPPGDYCIGAAGSSTANVYFLAVQGQTEGTTGDVEMPTLGDALLDVDFLLTEYDPSAEKRRAQFSLEARFNTSNGTFNVLSTDGVIHITFNEAAAFVISVTAHDELNVSHDYYINSRHCTEETASYPRS